MRSLMGKRQSGQAMKSLAFAAGLLTGGFALHSLLPSLYHKHLNPSVIRKTGVSHTVMLTFDDGPDPDYTGRLLDLLKKEEIHATFFLVAREAYKQEKLIMRMLAEGHVAGFHSVDHHNAMFRSFFHTRKDFQIGCEFLKEMGISHPYYRPPWGLTNMFTWHFVKKHGMKMVLWNVMAEDWEARSTAASIADKCLRRVKSGSIICLHDGGRNSGGAPGAPGRTIQALETIIPALKAGGYRFILPDEVEFNRKGVR